MFLIEENCFDANKRGQDTVKYTKIIYDSICHCTPVRANVRRSV